MEQQEMDQKIGAMVARTFIALLLAVDVWVLLTKDSMAAQILALVALVILLPLLIFSFGLKRIDNN